MATIKEFNPRMGIDWGWKEIPIEEVYKKINEWLSLAEIADLEKSKSTLDELLLSVSFYLQVFEGESITAKHNLAEKSSYLKELKAENAKLKSRIKELEGVKQDWQPIETAPKDGTSIIAIRYDYYDRIEAARCWFQPEFDAFITGCRQLSWEGGSELHSPDIFKNPIHWMPLPSAPSLASAIGGDDE